MSKQTYKEGDVVRHRGGWRATVQDYDPGIGAILISRAGDTAWWIDTVFTLESPPDPEVLRRYPTFSVGRGTFHYCPDCDIVLSDFPHEPTCPQWDDPTGLPHQLRPEFYHGTPA